MKKVVLGKTCLEMLAKDYHLCGQGIFVLLSTIPHRFLAKRVMQMGHHKPWFSTILLCLMCQCYRQQDPTYVLNQEQRACSRTINPKKAR